MKNFLLLCSFKQLDKILSVHSAVLFVIVCYHLSFLLMQ